MGICGDFRCPWDESIIDFKLPQNILEKQI
jgi:hypothetical protein